MDFIFVLFNFLVEGFLVEDDVVAVDQVLLQVVREHTFDGVDLVFIDDLADNCGSLCVGEAWLESSECSLESLVTSQDNISLLSFNGSSLISLGDNGVCSKSDETIDGSTKINLDDISFLDDCEYFILLLRVSVQGGIVSNDLIDGDANRESGGLL